MLGFFADQLETFGDNVALVTADGEAVSYRELAERADARARHFPDTATLLAIDMHCDLASVVDYTAALRARRPVILLGSTETATGQRIVDTYAPWIAGTPAPDAPLAVHPDLAVLMSTSGTTGSPKLVRLSRTNIDSNARAIASYLNITPTTRAITSLPLHYSYGLSVLNSHLAAGASVILTETPVNQPAFWELFEAQAATSIAGVPFSYELFERIGLRDRALPSLRTMTQAGGRMPPELVARYAGWAAERGIDFFVMYGATEATARMAYLPPAQALTHSDCIGVAIPGGRFRITNGESTGVGELIYTGPNVMMGYAEAQGDLARGAELGELATGDLAERTEDGLFRIVGRLNRFSKLFGLRISHDEIERHLAGQGLAAVVTGNDKHIVVQVGQDAVAAQLAAHYALPLDCFVVVGGETPRLPSGKPDYGALMRSADAIASTVSAHGRSIDAIFAASFPGLKPADNDSFISLGGDSLSYVTFSIALEDALGHAPANWEELTLAELRAIAAAPDRPARQPSVESDIVVRAAAICGVVALHTGLSQGDASIALAGGSPLLMVLFGYNLARFQRSKLLGDARWSVVASFFKRIILPYYAILIVFDTLRRDFDPASLLLVSNYIGRFGSSIEPFWFLEAVFQCLIFVAVLFAVPPLRELARQLPTAFSLTLLGIGLALKITGTVLLDQTMLQQRTFDATFIYVAMGWTAWNVRTQSARLALLGFSVLASAAAWGLVNSHPIWMGFGMAALLFIPRMPMPAAMTAPITAIAAASFYIYLSHIFVISVIRYRLGINMPWLSLVAALIVGILFWQAAVWAETRPLRRRATT